jgi:hypothetical protein
LGLRNINNQTGTRGGKNPNPREEERQQQNPKISKTQEITVLLLRDLQHVQREIFHSKHEKLSKIRKPQQESRRGEEPALRSTWLFWTEYP